MLRVFDSMKMKVSFSEILIFNTKVADSGQMLPSMAFAKVPLWGIIY